jgi:hypothetical protein
MSLVGTWGAISYGIRRECVKGMDLEMALFGVEEDMLLPEIGVMVEDRWHPISSFFPLT